MQPTPHTLFCTLGYLVATLFVLDVWIVTWLLPFALFGTCNFRLSAPKSTDVASESVIPGTPLEAATGKLSQILLLVVSQPRIRVAA